MSSKKSFNYIIWVDEAGRGAWAGPVVAAACALRIGYDYPFSSLLADSKKLSPKKREMIFDMIQDAMTAGICAWWVGMISADIIDQVGIREANRLAMEQAIHALINKIGTWYQGIQIDGRDNYRFRDIEPEIVQYIVRGDTFIPEIQAASILAKVSRDRLMRELDILHPEYGFEKHKWYGTRLHEKNLELYRPSHLHRKTYAPIKKLILEDM
jgi:ribonuclease HII